MCLGGGGALSLAVYQASGSVSEGDSWPVSGHKFSECFQSGLKMDVSISTLTVLESTAGCFRSAAVRSERGPGVTRTRLRGPQGDQTTEPTAVRLIPGERSEAARKWRPGGGDSADFGSLEVLSD